MNTSCEVIDLLIEVFPVVVGATTCTKIKEARIAFSLISFLSVCLFFSFSPQGSIGVLFLQLFLHIKANFTLMCLGPEARSIISHLRPQPEEFKSYFIILAKQRE